LLIAFFLKKIKNYKIIKLKNHFFTLLPVSVPAYLGFSTLEVIVLNQLLSKSRPTNLRRGSKSDKLFWTGVPFFFCFN
jgi:hypothetical protein